MEEFRQQKMSEKVPWIFQYFAGQTANSIFCSLTVFGTVFVLFLNKMGLPKSKIGFILSLFPFCGILALFVSQWVAKTGVRKVFITFWGLRQISIAAFLISPFIINRYGLKAGFIFVSITIMGFAICRSFGEMAYYPWMQEVLPNDMRGRISGAILIIYNFTNLLVNTILSIFVSKSDDIQTFIIIFGVGLLFGLMSVIFYIPIPGGKSRQIQADGLKQHERFLDSLGDKRFLYYLIGTGLFFLSQGAASFLPLFFKEELLLGSGRVLIVSMSASAGVLATSYLWGIMTDKYGGRRALLTYLPLSAIFPLLWVIMPRTSTSFILAIIVQFCSGLVGAGYFISDQRLLYTKIMPIEKNTAYMAVFYSWIGITGGLGPIIMGQVIDLSSKLHYKFWLINIDSYVIAFTVQVAMVLTSIGFIRKCR